MSTTQGIVWPWAWHLVMEPTPVTENQILAVPHAEAPHALSTKVAPHKTHLPQKCGTWSACSWIPLASNTSLFPARN